MSLDLNSYFKLGLDSTENPTNEAGLQNTIRTPTDTSSTNLNRITFKVPKIGMLTGDSHINVQFTTNPDTIMADVSNITPNFVNGALGCVKRFRILVDNKVLTDMEFPSLLTNPENYAKFTQTQLADYHYYLLANQFVNVQYPGQASGDTNVGTEIFSENERYVIGPNGQSQHVLSYDKVGTPAESNVYALPLRMLGAKFLESNSLPVFLLNDREMIIEITFHKDARQWLVKENGTLAANDGKVNLTKCELVSTHIMLNDELENNERQASFKNPVQYPLIDNYLIKGVIGQGGAVGTQASNIYRVHLNNRELHSLLMVFHQQEGNLTGQSRITANQVSSSLGDEQLQIKSNGQNLFDRPITNSGVFFQLLTYYNQGMALKCSFQGWQANQQSLYIPNNLAFGGASERFRDYRGEFHYLGVDFRNGNMGVFGAGTQQRSNLEIDYINTPRTATFPKQDEQRDLFFFVKVSKLLTLGGNVVNVSF